MDSRDALLRTRRKIIDPARKRIGWEFTIGLEEGLETTFACFERWLDAPEAG